MITNFPKARKKIREVINKLVREKVKQKGVMQNLANTKILYEGDQFGLIEEDGTENVGPLESSESTVMIKKKDLEENAAEHLLGKVDELATGLSDNVERGLAKTMMQAAEANPLGGLVKGEGAFSAESMLQALDKLDIEFEDDDRLKPIAPFLMTDPETAKKIAEEEQNTSPEQKEEFEKRQNEIYDRKYEKHMEDVNSRKIVD